MTTREVQVTAPRDAMRRIAEAVSIACKYSCDVYLSTDSKQINAKSLMGMMSFLNFSEKKLTITAHGKDEVELVNELAKHLALA